MSFNAKKQLKQNNNVSTYVLNSNVSSVNEGGSVIFTLTTTNVLNGTNVPYTISGVSPSDIGGAALTGNFVVNNNNTATLTLNITDDNLTENSKYLTVTSQGISKTVTINDVSPISLNGDIYVLGKQNIIALTRPNIPTPINPRNSIYEDLWKIKNITITSNDLDSTYNNITCSLNNTCDDAMGGYLNFTNCSSQKQVYISSKISYEDMGTYYDDSDSYHSWEIIFYDSITSRLKIIRNRQKSINDNTKATHVFPLTNWEIMGTNSNSDFLYDQLGNHIVSPANITFQFEYETTYPSPYTIQSSPIKLYNGSTLLKNINAESFYINVHNNIWYISTTNRNVYISTNRGASWSFYYSVPNSKIFGFWESLTYIYAFSQTGIWKKNKSNTDSWSLYRSGNFKIFYTNAHSAVYIVEIISSNIHSDKIFYLDSVSNGGTSETLNLDLLTSSYPKNINSFSNGKYITTNGVTGIIPKPDSDWNYYFTDYGFFGDSNPKFQNIFVAANNYNFVANNFVAYIGVYPTDGRKLPQLLMTFYTNSPAVAVNCSWAMSYSIGYYDVNNNTFIFLPDANHQYDEIDSKKIGYIYNYGNNDDRNILLRDEIQLPVADTWIMIIKNPQVN